MGEVARVQTRITARQAADGLVTHLTDESQFARSPTQKSAALLLAQLMLETGNGAACHNYNCGNITSNEHGSFFRPSWYSVDETSGPHLRQLHDLMLQGKAPRAFRAYESLEHGLRDYLAELRRDFPSLLEASYTEDPYTFARAIRTSRYTPDAPENTDDSIAALQRKFVEAGLFASLPLAVAAPASPAADSC